MEGVHQDQIRQRREPEHGAAHRRQRRAMDVDGVDLVGLGGCHRPGQGHAHDRVIEPLALGGRHQLRVGQPRNVAVGVEDDGAGHDGPGQAAAAHFVDAGHAYEPQPPQAFSSVRIARVRTIRQSLPR